MKTLKKIWTFLKSGFGFSKKEEVVEVIEATYEELVCEKPAVHEHITEESGGTVFYRPAFCYGVRKYYCPRKRLIFMERLPIYSVGRHYHPWYKISKTAMPPIEKFEKIRTTLSGKFFWLPWRVWHTRIEIPEGRKECY